LGVTPLLLGALLVAGLGTHATDDDPRNTSDAYYDAVNNAECLAHHEEDGFIPFGFGFVDPYTKLPINESINLQVRIKHITEYEGPHQVTDMSVTIDTSLAPNVEIDAAIGEDQALNTEARLAHRESLEETLLLQHGAYEGKVTARVVETDPPLSKLGMPGTLTLDAAGMKRSSDSGSLSMDLDHGFFQDRSPGNHTFAVTWETPLGSPLVPMEAHVEMEIWINHTTPTEFTFPAPKKVLNYVGHETIVDIPVRITSEEPALLDFRIRGVAFWEHMPGDGAPLDHGVYYRFMTLEVEGSDQAELQADRTLSIPAPAVLVWVLLALGLLAGARRLHNRPT
jgi:hypothetical protein